MIVCAPVPVGRPGVTLAVGSPDRNECRLSRALLFAISGVGPGVLLAVAGHQRPDTLKSPAAAASPAPAAAVVTTLSPPPETGGRSQPFPSLGVNRRPHAALRAGELLETSIRDLGNFDYDADRDSSIPPDVWALDGHPVRLRGYMVPLDQASDISRFALVPSLFSCCFGQPPQVQHTVAVTCPAGKAVSYCPDEVVVVGQLRVAVVKDDVFVISVFSVAATSVKAAER